MVGAVRNCDCPEGGHQHTRTHSALPEDGRPTLPCIVVLCLLAVAREVLAIVKRAREVGRKVSGLVGSLVVVVRMVAQRGFTMLLNSSTVSVHGREGPREILSSRSRMTRLFT